MWLNVVIQKNFLLYGGLYTNKIQNYTHTFSTQYFISYYSHVNNDREMNNTKRIALVSIITITAFMITASAVVPGHDVMAGNKKKHNLKNSRIHVGDTSTNAIQAADNTQTVVNGAGSTGTTAINAPANAQSQAVNSGSTGVGGGGAGGSVHIGDTSTNAIQAADNSQTVVNGAGSTGTTAINAPANAQSQAVNSGNTGIC
jgi:hypothetical protein